MKTETIYETYIRQMCSNCKNRNADLRNIRRNVKGTLKCIYYEKKSNTKAISNLKAEQQIEESQLWG